MATVHAAAIETLRQLGLPASRLDTLREWARPDIRNAAGLRTGQIRPAFELRRHSAAAAPSRLALIAFGHRAVVEAQVAGGRRQVLPRTDGVSEIRIPHPVLGPGGVPGGLNHQVVG